MTLRLRKEISIDRPPADVWPHVSDLDEELRWRRPEVVALAADDDPLAPGTRVEGTTRAFGMTDTYVNEVIEVAPPHRLAWRGVEASGGVLGTAGSYDLEPERGGTRFRLTMRYEPQGLSGRLQAPLLGLALRRIGGRFVRQLKELAEAA
jgi:uncharacterized protein YndB with AHSA1/START domain